MCAIKDTFIVAGASYKLRLVARSSALRCCPCAAAGGWSGTSSLRDVHVFDVGTCVWSEVETKGIAWNGWAGSVFALANDGASLLVFGGHSASQVMRLLVLVRQYLCNRMWFCVRKQRGHGDPASDDERVSHLQRRLELLDFTAYRGMPPRIIAAFLLLIEHAHPRSCSHTRKDAHTFLVSCWRGAGVSAAGVRECLRCCTRVECRSQRRVILSIIGFWWLSERRCSGA
jgi:hypothetical protein